MTSPADADETIDFESRRLCPDEGCIGVVGPDGRCKVCGLAAPDAAPGERATVPVTVEPAADGDRPVPDEAVEAEGERDAQGPGGEQAAGWDDRELCPDGACIGVIGPDGRCKVCGRRAGETE